MVEFNFGAKAQLKDAFQSPVEREMYENSPGAANEPSIFDATNPMELMNFLRKATAMDDATSPSDAVDQALRSFEYKESDDLLSSPSQVSLP